MHFFPRFPTNTGTFIISLNLLSWLHSQATLLTEEFQLLPRVPPSHSFLPAHLGTWCSTQGLVPATLHWEFWGSTFLLTLFHVLFLLFCCCCCLMWKGGIGNTRELNQMYRDLHSETTHSCTDQCFILSYVDGYWYTVQHINEFSRPASIEFRYSPQHMS